MISNTNPPVLALHEGRFIDPEGRDVLLRGVNLSANCKLPLQHGSREYRQTFFSIPHKVSFVNRPFPLAEADEHFSRLKSWGLTSHRLIITWEAVEHDGPGKYDEDFLNYLSELAGIGERHGMSFYIDPHQDVWSRISGGSGAPAWTFEKAGFYLPHFNVTGAAQINLRNPLMYRNWPDEYGKLAPATMFTLFFGGNDFAPATLIDGETAQNYLQRHYINAMKKVRQALSQHRNVFAFGTMNEPSRGYITWLDLNSSALLRYETTDGIHRHHHSAKKAFTVNLRMQFTPTPIQSFALGDGIPQRVDYWGILFGPVVFSKKWMNTEKKRVWKEGVECIWKQNGVWDEKNGNPVVRQPDYFASRNGQKVNFENNYLKPFIQKFAHEIRSIQPATLIFIQSTPMFPVPQFTAEEAKQYQLVNASHWYDYFNIFTGMFFSFFTMDFYRNGKFIWGSKNRMQLFRSQISEIITSSKTGESRMPDIIGEFGVSYRSFWGINLLLGWFGMQYRALNASFQALESLKLSATIYNYCATNTNRTGDEWNKENLSIFSRSRQKNKLNLNSGARALHGFLRPYPMKTAGTIHLIEYNQQQRRFRFSFYHKNGITAPTEIFLPKQVFGVDFRTHLSDGTFDYNPLTQIFSYRHSAEMELHEINIQS